MANTYTLIASSTVGSGGAANIEFTSIPNTYTDLLIKYSLRTTDTVSVYTDINVQLNSTNSSGGKVLYAISGTTVGSYSPNAAQSFFAMADGDTATASTFGNGEIYIPNYLSSNNKSLSGDSVIENNGTNNGINLAAGLYSVTSAVTSFKLTPAASLSFKQYSTAYLYGIKNS